MTNKIWLGGIYLKDEGGYEIILKSLNHYKNRLKTLSESPELKRGRGNIWFNFKPTSKKNISQN